MSLLKLLLVIRSVQDSTIFLPLKKTGAVVISTLAIIVPGLAGVAKTTVIGLVTVSVVALLAIIGLAELAPEILSKFIDKF